MESESTADGISTGRLVDRLAVAMMVAVTIGLFVSGLYAPQFTTDSWSYFELSGTVFEDFYRYNTVRQLEVQSPYSDSFPPLWPVLMALVRQISDIGIYSGYLLNFVVCLGLLAALVWLARRLGMPGSVGAAAYGCVLTFPDFLAEVLAARSIPLSALLLTIALCILTRLKIRPVDAGLAGLCMGFNCLNRFDVLLAALVLGCAVAVQGWRDDRRLAAALARFVSYFALMFLAISPWSAYSMQHFGKPLAMGNSRQVQVAVKGTVLDYYEHPPTSDLIHRPGTWLKGLATKKAPLVVNSLMEAFLGSALPLLMALGLMLWKTGALGQSPQKTQFAQLALPLIPFLMLPCLLAGYARERYFSTSFLILAVVLLALLHSLNPSVWRARRVLLLLAIIVATPIYIHGFKPLYHSGLPNLTDALAPLRPTADMEKLTAAVRVDAAGMPHRLLITAIPAASVYGALTGEPTVMIPKLRDGDFAAFVRDWQPTHAFDPEGTLKEMDLAGVELVPLELPGLFRVHPKPETRRQP